MSFDNNSRKNFDEQRKRRAENFRLNISDNYDDDGASQNNEPAEINSYSGQDVKEQSARESKNALKKKKKVEKKERKAKDKRNSRVFRWMWVASVVIVGVMLAAFIVTGMNDLLAVNRQDKTEVSVEIPKDATLEQVTDILAQNSIIDQPFYFKMFATITKSTDDFSKGTYQLTKNMDYQEILTNLESDEGREVVTVTIIPGENVVEIANDLKREGVLSEVDEFLELCKSNDFDNDFSFLKDIKNASERYYKLEGYLHPDKYDFYVDEDPKNVIYKFLNNYESKISDKEDFSGYEDLSTVKKMIENGETDYTLDEIMIIASIIQAEAANENDMYYVSSVIHNRLKYGVEAGVSHLGLDSTKFYPYKTAKDAPDGYESKYDTYKVVGLPAGPICNPEMKAIKAAICPEDTSYLYFCHDKDGNAYYASTSYEHELNLGKIE